MRRINDSFNDVAHLNDLDPRYDRENDDVRDRVEFGEARQREWIPRGGRVRKAPARPRGSWQAAVRSWLERHPNGGYQACADAVVGMGHAGVTRAKVAEVMRSQPKSAGKSEQVVGVARPQPKRAKKTKQSAVRRAVPRQRLHVPRPRPPEPPPVKIRYCDGCDLAVSESGACRC